MLDLIDKKYWLMAHPADTVGNVGNSDISVSCPICMEGKSWKRKHRLHLYTKPSYDASAIACFNCGYKSNMYNYLKEYHPGLYPLYKNEKMGSSFESLKVYHDEELEKPKELKEQEIHKTTNEFKPNNLIEPVEGFKNIKDYPEVLNYLKNRGIEPRDWLYSPKDNKIEFNLVTQNLSEYIIIPLTYKDKWYGFQALAWKQKKFYVYMATGNHGFKVWNYFNTDKNKPIYVFESIYDALSSGLENSIAILGADLSSEILNDAGKDNIVFALDNQRIDEKSKEQTIKYLEDDYKCFIWPEGSERFKDTNDLRKIGVSKEDISKMILSNIHSGMIGLLTAKMIR